MSTANDLAALFRRDLTRLLQELRAFPNDQTLWQTVPGITNSAGNLVLHLEGNLREFIGRQLGAIPYQRHREQEFSLKDLPASDLIARIEDLQHIIPEVLASLSIEALAAAYPENVLKVTMSTQQFIVHLSGHLNWHLGQIDYLRRFLTQQGSIELARL